MVYRAAYFDYFRTGTKPFPAIGFLVQVLEHLPDPRCRLLRTYGLNSSRGQLQTPSFIRTRGVIGLELLEHVEALAGEQNAGRLGRTIRMEKRL